jgi:hypothetical protein
MLSRTSAAFLLASTLALGACVGGDPITDEVVAPDDDTGKADDVTELKVRAGETTLWLTKALVRRDGAFVLRGRTSRNLESGNAYVMDDPFGDWLQKSARVFEVSYGISAVGPLFDGTNLFISLSPTTTEPVTARAIVRPRLTDSAGSSKISFTAELTPVIDAGTTVYRAQGRVTVAATEISATAGTARLVDATHFELDLSRAEVIALAGTATTIDVSARLATSTVVRRAHLGLSVKKLGLTTGDAYETWPSPTCTTEVRACLTALPDGALDLSSCGEAVVTRACQGQLGVSVDTAAIDAALDGADTRLTNPGGFVADSVGLVGADHASAFQSALGTRVTASIDALAGRWYLSTTARSSQLAAAVDGPFDAAYARPLELVPAHPPVPGDAVRIRHVVADAVLAYLATQDYLHTDFERTIEQLAREFRTEWVASIRSLRDTQDIFHDPAHPDQDIYLGEWLNTHVEVTIDRTTGAALHVLVELD